MGVYDFNTTAYDINEIIRQLKHELQSIVVNSQSSITEIKQKISADEALLDRLKKEVDELPDFTEQYNELLKDLGEDAYNTAYLPEDGEAEELSMGGI